MILLKKSIQYLILFLFGGISYYFIEIFWRGYSHLGMLILGGICFLLIGSINGYYYQYRKSPILLQLIISGLIITILELISGIILNIWLGLDIWDYSHLKYNFMGQICLKYSLKWLLIALPAIILYDYINYWLFDAEKPDYKLI